MNGLTAEDDEFHPVARDEDSWTETCWFAAAVPERGLGVWTYPLFRPRLGIMSCGVYVWEPGAEELWQLPYYRTWWHLPFPGEQSLADLSLPNGLRYRRLEPLRSYEVAYEDGDAIALELRFDALHPPHPHGVRDGLGHFDQLGRVTGELVLHGERIAIDCVEMRDRTWGPRRESRQHTALAYDYGARSSTSGFHCSTLVDRETGQYRLLTGFVLDGRGVVELAEAVREVERDDHGRPVAVRIRARDLERSPLDVRGEVVSRFGMPSTPWFNWVSLVRWTLPDGSTAYGEDQETWSPERFRALRRERAA